MGFSSLELQFQPFIRILCHHRLHRLWVILPVSYDEPEDKNIKKLYRNPDDKTLGGVASQVWLLTLVLKLYG
jgi:hypothetical protein